MTGTCPVCGRVLDSTAECHAGHRRASEALHRTLTSTIRALDETAAQLRQIALRLDSLGDMTAKDVHEQARQAERRARRIALLLETQTRWPETPGEG